MLGITPSRYLLVRLPWDQPWIPLTDRSQFALFNTSKFTGMPSEANPYNDGSPDDTNGARLMYLNVKAK